jgi:hypothetical protein
MEKILLVDTQSIRAKLLNQLQGIFDMTVGIAKGKVKNFRDDKGVEHKVTLKQWEKWARIAAYAAQVMSGLTTGFDEKQFQTDLKKLEVIVAEVQKRGQTRKKIQQLYDESTPDAIEDKDDVPEDAVEFCREWLKFNPTPYQIEFLNDSEKRIVLLWSRQSGKSWTIAAKAIWHSLTHPKTLTLIVAPTSRQSMILSDRIQDHLANLMSRRKLVQTENEAL